MTVLAQVATYDYFCREWVGMLFNKRNELIAFKKEKVKKIKVKTCIWGSEYLLPQLIYNKSINDTMKYVQHMKLGGAETLETTW